MADLTKTYVAPNENNPIKQNSATRQILEVLGPHVSAGPSTGTDSFSITTLSSTGAPPIERMKADNKGSFIFTGQSGIDTSTFGLFQDALIQVYDNGALPSFQSLTGIANFVYGPNINPANIEFDKTRGTNPSSNVLVLSGDSIGEIDFGANDGTGYKWVSSIQVTMESTPAAGNLAARMVFFSGAEGVSNFDVPVAGLIIGTENTPSVMMGMGNNFFTRPTGLFGQQAGLVLTYPAGRYSMGTFFASTSSGNAPAIEFCRTRASSPSTSGTVVVQSGDGLMEIDAGGDDGTGYQWGGSLQFRVDSTGVGAGSMPTRFLITTASSGSVSPTIRVTYDSKGNTVLNTGSVAASATDGFLHIATTTSSPTGTPTAYAGRVPMVYDTGNNKLWIYNTAWKGAAFV